MTLSGKDIEKRVRTAITEKVFPGCVVGVVRADGERMVLPFRRLTYVARGEKVKEDTIYDVASITKSIPTASLALKLLHEGHLKLSDSVRKFLPELRNDRDATIEDLLAYRVRGLQLSSLKDRTPDEILAHVFECGFFPPSGVSEYTNLPALLLGIIIRRVTGKMLNVLAQEEFFAPLGMKDTAFSPSFAKATEGKPHDMNRIAPTEVDGNGTDICGIVHDESARVFARAGIAVGHAGLFSTAPDILNFLEALLQGRYPYITAGAYKGLGWQLNQPWMGKPRGDASRFGKTGFTGTSCVVDVERGVAFVILSNRTYPHRPPDTTAINVFRRDIGDIILSALG